VCLREARAKTTKSSRIARFYRLADRLHDWTGRFPPWKMSVNAFFVQSLATIRFAAR
jgi:hypothetical protein